MPDTIQTTRQPGANGGGDGLAEQALLAELRPPEVNQQTIAPGVAAIEVRGELDLATVGLLEAKLDGALTRGSSPLLIDLTGCGFIDSSVVNLFLNLRARLNSGRQRYAVVAEDQPLRMLLLTGLDHKLPVFASPREALRALEGAEASASAE